MKRRFGVTDALLLIAAAAGALAVNRLNWLGFVARWRHPVDAHDSIEHMLAMLTPHLAAGTVAQLVLRIRRPRPSFRRLGRQPGTVACAVALGALVVIACWVWINTSTGQLLEYKLHLTKADRHGMEGGVRYPIYPFSGRLLVAFGDRIGFAVAGAWLALWLAGWWRAEPTWIDRMGRALGSLWVILTLVVWLRCYTV